MSTTTRSTESHDVIQLKAIELESDAPLPTQVPPFHLRVVLPTRRNSHTMQLFQVDPSESGSEFFRKLREMSRHEQSSIGRVLQSLVLVFSMQKLAVSSAVIVPMDQENQIYPQPVSISSAAHNTFLSDGFVRPETFLGHPNVVSRHASFAVDDTEIVGGDLKAILIGPVFSPALACFWLGLAIMASAAGGIGVGIVKNSIVNGVGFGSGLLAMLTAIQALVLWRVS